MSIYISQCGVGPALIIQWSSGSDQGDQTSDRGSLRLTAGQSHHLSSGSTLHTRYLWSIWSDALVSGPRGHGNISSSGLISQERRGGGGGDMDADCLGRDWAEDVGKWTYKHILNDNYIYCGWIVQLYICCCRKRMGQWWMSPELPTQSQMGQLGILATT